MMFRLPISAAVRVACLVSMLLLASAGAQEPEKVRLKYASASGDRHVSEGGMEMQFDIHVTAGEQDVPVIKTASSEQEKYTQDVLGVDGRGRPTGIRRAYSVSRKSDTEPGADPKVRVTSLQGKTVAVRRTGGKVTVTTSGGKLAPEDHKSMLSVLDHPEQEFFPERDLGPGDEWQVDPKIARTIFKGGDSTAQIRCKWEETVEYAGHRCARISIQMDIQGMPADSPGPLTMKLAGSLYHALDLGRMISIDFAGPIEMTGEKTENGVVYKFKGDGTMRIRESRRWLRVDGKTLAAPVRPDGAQPAPSPARETSTRVLLASAGGQPAEKVRLQYASAVGGEDAEGRQVHLQGRGLVARPGDAALATR